jgi:hypothetical protein
MTDLCNKLFKTEIEFMAHDLKYQPERPPAACCNPSDPRFTIPGERESVEHSGVSLMVKTVGGDYVAVKLPDFVADYLIEEIYTTAREEYEKCRGEYEAERAEHIREIGEEQ